MVKKAIEDGTIKELQEYASIRAEVKYGLEGSRIDLLLEDAVQGLCYVEVKSVTLVQYGQARFPDTVSVRGSKHLRELMAMVEAGHRVVIFYCVQRGDAESFAPADDIDPEYGAMLRQAVKAGVEALVYEAAVGQDAIQICKTLPIHL